MANKLTSRPYHQVRRADRAVTEDGWIRRFLQEAPMGALATRYEGQPFINSNLFVYDSGRHVIYLHTARSGRTRSNVEAHERVCFSVSEMGRLLPAEVAQHFSVEYRGVTVFGHMSIVADAGEAAAALQLLLDKYFPHLQAGRDYRPVVAEELKRTTVYRLDIESWSGKQKQVADDFPGAFHYDRPPREGSVPFSGEVARKGNIDKQNGSRDMEFSLEKSLQILARTPDVLEALLSRVDGAWVYHNEGRDSWRPFDVVGHLIIGELTDWIVRMETILDPAIADKRFRPFERTAMIERDRGKSLEDLLEMFRQLRNENLAKLRDTEISNGDLDKTGIHPEFGEVTLRQLLATWVVHDLGHIAQIARVMAKQYKDEVGPWAAYLPVLHDRVQP